MISEIAKIESEYYQKKGELRERYAMMYKDAVINIIKSLGMWGVDVINKETGEIGQLDLVPAYNDLIQYDVKFRPYTKSGKLSIRYKNMYVFGKLEEVLPLSFEVVE